MKRLALMFAAATTMLLLNGLVFAQDTTLTITSGGNVGIGTTAPTYKLDVTGNLRALNPNAQFTFDGFPPFNNTTLAGTFTGLNGYGPQLRFVGAPFGFMDIGQDSIGNFVIESLDIPRVVVDGFGNVGFGTTPPQERLHVAFPGNVSALVENTNSEGGFAQVQTRSVSVSMNLFAEPFAGGVGTNSPHPFYIRTNLIERMRVTTGGNVLFWGDVGIGTTTPDQRLSVNGNASKVGGGTWATFSDLRMKQDIGTFGDGLSVLKGIRPVTFRYNGKLGYPTDKTYVGVIAQEIKTVAPYTVDSYRAKLNPDDVEETDILRFDGTALTYIAINAIKELDAKVEQIRELQNENQNLSSRLAELEALVKSLAEERTSVEGKSLGELR
jgi:hypothetical protein